jgi:hypothetical protein
VDAATNFTVRKAGAQPEAGDYELWIVRQVAAAPLACVIGNNDFTARPVRGYDAEIVTRRPMPSASSRKAVDHAPTGRRSPAADRNGAATAPAR